MRLFLLLLLLSPLSASVFSQKNNDSLLSLIDSAQKNIKETEVQFQEWDSAQKATVHLWQEKNSKSLDQFLAEKKEEERKEERRNYLLAGLGALLLVVLAFRLLSARKKRRPPRS